MDDYMMTGSQMDIDRPASAISAGNVMRIAGQVAGLVLIIAGGCYALLVVVAVLNIARDPSHMTTLLGTMAKAVGLEETTIVTGQNKIPIGRTVGCVLLIAWYQITAWIALKLVATGGQLVSNASAERREFLAAIKQMSLNSPRGDRSR
jgi:F0F1-type ATP synthase membrane subunit c/vacuolar-type H+-ATPase subunit K